MMSLRVRKDARLSTIFHTASSKKLGMWLLQSCTTVYIAKPLKFLLHECSKDKASSSHIVAVASVLIYSTLSLIHPFE